MVRMSDILKRAREKGKEPKQKKEKKAVRPKVEKKPAPAPLVESSPESIKSVKEAVKPKAKIDEAKKPEKPGIEQEPKIKPQEQEKVETPEVRISPVMMKRTKIVSNEEGVRLYEESVSLMRGILKENVNPKSIDVKDITAVVEKIIEQLILDNNKLLGLTLTRESKGENYLFCHSVNVCIYSMVIGIGLDYVKIKLIELGIAALLHDIGMPEYLPIVNQPRELTAQERKEIKEHSAKGTKILEKVKGIEKSVLYAVHQQHERIDGTGYPRGTRKESIGEYAGIIAIADVYEAMIHPRAHRNEFLPIEAIQKIIANKKAFEYKFIKILIEKIGIFPIGSFVQLNTKEIARVLRLNHEVLLRPVIEIAYEADGEKPQQIKILDLATLPTICIKKALRKDELKASFY